MSFLNHPEIYIVHVKNIPIYQQLQLEEALLRADNRNWCVINEGSPPAIVVGISGKPNELINSQKLSQNPIPVIRRFSGGGTVVVDYQTCFVTFICNNICVDVPGIPDKIINWTGSIYENVFDKVGFSIRENDYVLGEKKFGGNAQYICKYRWLHHSSLLWNFHKENMDYLLIPMKAPLYRQQRSHLDFLCKLCDYLPSQELMLSRLYESLNERFNTHNVNWNEALDITKLPHRKGTTLIT